MNEESAMIMVTNIDQIDIKNFFKIDPLPYAKTCITIGNFDGVHLGHQAIISKMVNQANAKGKPLVLITFFPNPVELFKQKLRSFYLSTPAEKERQLLRLGVDQVITLQFDRDLANLSAEEFLSSLKEKFGLNTLVVGEDFALGKNRQGTVPVLKDLSQALSFKLKVLSPVRLGDRAISSTKIREQLDEGDVREAAALLGRNYAVAGVVTHGSDRGKKIGLPTANIQHWEKKKLPATGVYATRVYLWHEVFQGITNVGYRPTFGDQKIPNIETFIFDFDADIYGEKMRLEFIQKIRDEKKFPGVDALLAQIALDKIEARRILSDDET